MIPIHARREGNALILQFRHDKAAQAIAFDTQADPLARLLAAVASGVMQSAVATAAIRDDEALRAAALALVEGEPVTLTGSIVTLRIPLGDG